MRVRGKGGGAIGTADKVIEDVCRLRDEYGVTHLMVAPWRGPNHKDVMRSLELFAKEVMPVVNS